MNYCIVNKKPQQFQTIEFGEQNLIIENKTSVAVKEIYACLHCEELRNITLIVKSDQVYNVTLVFEDVKKFQKILKSLQESYPTMEVSQQNKKINGYAAAVIEKLSEGIENGIVDTKEQDNIKYCPICGMECDPNIPYCMECGAEVQT